MGEKEPCFKMGDRRRDPDPRGVMDGAGRAWEEQRKRRLRRTSQRVMGASFLPLRLGLLSLLSLLQMIRSHNALTGHHAGDLNSYSLWGEGIAQRPDFL